MISPKESVARYFLDSFETNLSVVAPPQVCCGGLRAMVRVRGGGRVRTMARARESTGLQRGHESTRRLKLERGLGIGVG